MDALAEWRRSLCEALFDIGFRVSMVEACLWILRDEKVYDDGSKLVGLVLVDADGVLLGGRGPVWETAYAKLSARFEWGKLIMEKAHSSVAISRRMPTSTFA